MAIMTENDRLIAPSFFFRPLGDTLQIPLADWRGCPLLRLSTYP